MKISVPSPTAIPSFYLLETPQGRRSQPKRVSLSRYDRPFTGNYQLTGDLRADLAAWIRVPDDISTPEEGQTSRSVFCQERCHPSHRHISRFSLASSKDSVTGRHAKVSRPCKYPCVGKGEGTSHRCSTRVPRGVHFFRACWHPRQRETYWQNDQRVECGCRRCCEKTNSC